jgi:hypothetical protein
MLGDSQAKSQSEMLSLGMNRECADTLSRSSLTIARFVGKGPQQ